uniref:Signal transduction response regulator receiver region domain protein n=1 Tax=uncultured organism TaxID=155900 RepID=M1P133_9ZZZZ|nr:signal transduction response regulator receiver region domain protein [uncultured organism]
MYIESFKDCAVDNVILGEVMGNSEEEIEIFEEGMGEKPETFKIMVVEDDQEIREKIREDFDKEDYDLRFVESGEWALEVLEDEIPDLIMLDSTLPGMSGWKTLGKIKDRGILEDVPVVMFTVSDLSFVKMLHEDIAGALGYVEKPLDKSELLETVREVVNTNRDIKSRKEEILAAENGGETLAEAYEAWSRSCLIRKRFIKRLDDLEEEYDEKEKVEHIESLKEGEKKTIEKLKKKKKDLIESVNI